MVQNYCTKIVSDLELESVVCSKVEGIVLSEIGSVVSPPPMVWLIIERKRNEFHTHEAGGNVGGLDSKSMY